ncbi:mycothiol transferase [Streptomyces sp. CRN 30]|uniref:mycothiol transferase n=1 Tax=Streptomyces sp. CRN 30 TaxID=3075613 RepID=UPI002A817217|nr:DinB family protein [Streptomyces sp. CRN 30]
MHAKDVLIEAYGRIQEEVHSAVDGLGADLLAARPAPDANSVAWLVWHLTRVQDDHVADAFGLDQVWRGQGWEKRFGLDLPAGDTGYGHGPAQVAKVRVDSADLLTGYYDAVHEQTLGALRSLSAADLERVVDDNWDPPVTLAARLVSVLADDLQHVGQAAYARGLLRSTEDQGTEDQSTEA